MEFFESWNGKTWTIFERRRRGNHVVRKGAGATGPIAAEKLIAVYFEIARGANARIACLSKQACAALEGGMKVSR